MTVLSSLRALHVLVILFLLQFSPVVVFSASTPLTGEVSLPTRFAAGQTVRVTIVGHAYVKTTVTRMDGSFSFDNVPPGDYVVEVNCPGYEPGSLELQSWSPGSCGKSLSLSDVRSIGMIFPSGLRRRSRSRS